MKVTVLIHEPHNKVEYDRRRFFMEDEGDLSQLTEDIERYISDTYYELQEEV